MNRSRASLSWSAWVQAIACGPPSTTDQLELVDQAGQTPAGVGERQDPVGVAVHDQHRHVELGEVAASAIAAVACIPAWLTDFRRDLPRLDVPVLLVHGDADRILPFPNTGKRLPGLIDQLEVVVIEGGPHAIAWTHADQVNDALLRFIGAQERAIAA